MHIVPTPPPLANVIYFPHFYQKVVKSKDENYGLTVFRSIAKKK